MNKVYNFISLAVMAFATVGCLGELNTDVPSAESGDEVQFGLSLPGMTRTTYGDKNATGTAYPIYWVDGDKVQVYSPQCLAGRNDAEYKVSVTSRTQNYATSLTPTGVNGVQWGNGPAMFYSVYPSGDYEILDDGKIIQGLKINFSDDFEVYDDGTIVPKGADCLMFAKTSDYVALGHIVNLTYSPIATTLMLTLRAPSDQSIVKEHTIQSINLIAPKDVNIAGRFNVKLETINASERYVHTNWQEDASTSNIVQVKIYDKATGAFHKIKQGDDNLLIPISIAPLQGLTIDENWKIEVETRSEVPQTDGNGKVTYVSTKKVFSKSLAFNEDFTATLVPGMVHELPALPALDIKEGAEEEWKVEEWMERIPRNVYLSEVSIPGTWNSLNPEFQDNTSISQQYKKGVRAFHLDTRWQASRNGTFGNIYNPTITGISICDGSTSYSVTGQSGRVNGTNAQTFEKCLTSIVENVKNNEYMVLFCTFAQDSYSGDRCPSTWMQAISDVCDKINNSTDEKLAGKIFDASTLTANTLVGDVLNHLIVIVNLDKPITNYELPPNSKCLFTYVPMNLPNNHYTFVDNTISISDHIDPLYYSSKQTTGISMYTSHAQISNNGTSSVNCGDRGYSHPLTSRDALINGIWDWSKNNYGTSNYKHDHWIYLGLGGYILTSSNGNESGYDTVENRYAAMISDRIEAMGKNGIPFYPVGILLMNNKKGANYTDTNGNDIDCNFEGICKKILLLNNAYTLQYDPEKPIDWNPNVKPASDYGATANNGGNVILID